MSAVLSMLLRDPNLSPAFRATFPRVKQLFVTLHFVYPHRDNGDDTDTETRIATRAQAARVLRIARADGDRIEGGADGSYCVHINPGDLPRELRAMPAGRK